MVRLKHPSFFALSAFCIGLFACDKSTAPQRTPEEACLDLSSATFGDSGIDHYRIIAPNGGETYKVGDSLRITVTSGPQDSEAVLQILVTSNGTVRSALIPGSPRSSLDTRKNCHIGFIIPDSIGTGLGGKFSLVSDSVRIRVAKYNEESFVNDVSDGYFKITD